METWLVDSGDSRHMTGLQKSVTSLIEQNSQLQLELGDNSKYVVKGVGTTLFQLNSGNPLKMSEVLYIPRLKKNLLSISSLEDRGYAVDFVDGKVLSWINGLSLDSEEVIGTHDENLCKMTGHPTQALVHDSENICEFWHRKSGHLHYQALPVLRKMVTGLPDFEIKC
jgi:hypothetical protein